VSLIRSDGNFFLVFFSALRKKHRRVFDATWWVGGYFLDVIFFCLKKKTAAYL
jgi:hypothetical protein